MARPAKTPPDATRRKLIGFDQETWHALNLLARDSASSFQELADEAFRDLLKKHGRPADLRAALKASADGGRTTEDGRQMRGPRPASRK
jgi:hypothetical protein